MVARQILASPSDGTDFAVLGCSGDSRSIHTFYINQFARLAVIAAYMPLKMANRQTQNQ